MELPLIHTSQRLDTNSLLFTLDIQPELRCFQGHFDAAPVLAGVVQVDWVMALATRLLEQPLVFRGLQSVKFLKLIRPPVLMTLTIDCQPERGLLKFSYRAGEIGYSSGAVRVDPWEQRL